MRYCPECGQTGNCPVCHHFDAAGKRSVPTLPMKPSADTPSGPERPATGA